ncbi:MAG: hypothetical protein A2X64_10990 [Ignavibacteria bacterium GWF2_33_9]|nr:MAG: hypothetical protein A2X64_10990 [Ignavibacteria bacterium GWF2_33_9]
MDFELIILIFLILLGVGDLSIGVANDAINFTNAAMGSKAAKIKFIMIVAGLGIFLGTMFSGGMMEIAKKGIFNPQFFTYPEVMFIFLSAMVGNVILLDFFNTYGLPTSTTVSIIGNLLGGALGMAAFKVIQAGLPFGDIAQFINISKVLSIFISIIASIIFAFIFGFLAQWITRLIFSFDYKKNLKKWGALWGSISVVFITNFVLLKGLKHAEFMNDSAKAFFAENNTLILAILFVLFWIIFQIIFMFTKVNAFKGVVLYGTFALAMAFAANDLVNFIGVPIGGLDAYMIAKESTNPSTLLMVDLGKDVMKAPTWILMFAGLIMFITIFTSKKSRTVAQTEISLGRQHEGYERFQPNGAARIIVATTLGFVDILKKITPNFIQNLVRKQFNVEKFKAEIDEHGNKSSFDLLRATIILMISSFLIALGTSFKLPLSTTYITFIAAMAAALPDKAWGRESAVYRVSGVITVVGGWFVTAIFAAILSLIIALILGYTENWGVLISIIIVGFVLYNSMLHHRRRDLKAKAAEAAYVLKPTKVDPHYYREFLEQITKYVANIYTTVSTSLESLINNDGLKLRKIRSEAKVTAQDVNILSINIINMLEVPDENIEEFSNYSTKIIGNLQTLAHRALLLTEQNYYYIANSHTKLDEEQVAEIQYIIFKLNKMSAQILENLHNVIGFKESSFNENIEKFVDKIDEFNKNQLGRVKISPKPMKRNILFFSILTDMDLIAENSRQLYKSLRKVFKKIVKGEAEIE